MNEVILKNPINHRIWNSINASKYKLNFAVQNSFALKKSDVYIDATTNKIDIQKVINEIFNLQDNYSLLGNLAF